MATVIGLLGGTFDPPHMAHVHLACTAMRAFSLDGVRLMPCRIPPHKSRPDMASADHRAAMCRLACDGTAGLSVERVELDRDGPSYTADTLRILSQREPAVRWRLIMGADMVEILHTWRDPETVLALGHPILACRPGYRLSATALAASVDASLHRYLPELCAGYLDLPPMEVSSSAVRAAVAGGADIAALVPEAVASYIRSAGLYRAR